MAFMERVLRRAVSACNATLLHIHLHRFSDSGGISGVALQAATSGAEATMGLNVGDF